MNKDHTELKEILKKYKITKKDLHIEMWGEQIKFVIITRAGIQKIEALENIVTTYTTPPELQVPDQHQYVVKGVASMVKDGKTITYESYGEASPLNLKMERWDKNKEETVPMVVYPFAMALKRALSRVILGVTGLYKYSVMGEDESDEFKDKMAKTQKEQEKTTPKKDDGKTTEIASSS